MYTRHHVLSEPYSSRATTTASHPQLRDLLAFIPSSGPTTSNASTSSHNAVTTVTYDSLASHSLSSDRPPQYTPLRFSPCCITYGCGLIAAGGQNSEIALKSAQVGEEWCHQVLPHSTESGRSGTPSSRMIGSINNSLNISPSPAVPALPRLLVSSNDEVIKVYDIVGRVPDWRGAERRRKRQRKMGKSVVEESWEAERRAKSSNSRGRSLEGEDVYRDEEEEEVEEEPSYDIGGSCTLLPRPEFDIHFSTPINHCSVSPNGNKLVAVGDSNEVFLFNVKTNGEYELVETIEASDDASFSTDWDVDSSCFAVASQDGFVHVYDHRYLPTTPSPSGTPNGFLPWSSLNRKPRTVATLQTTQRGPAGAARKVKFSPGGRGRIDAGLLAFTEHRNRIHVVDSRTFESTQILEIPFQTNQFDRHTSFEQSSSSSTILQVWDNDEYDDDMIARGGGGSTVVPLRPRPQLSSSRSNRSRPTASSTRTNDRRLNFEVDPIRPPLNWNSTNDEADWVGTTAEVDARAENQVGDPRMANERYEEEAGPRTSIGTDWVRMRMPEEGSGEVWPIMEDDARQTERLSYRERLDRRQRDLERQLGPRDASSMDESSDGDEEEVWHAIEGVEQHDEGEDSTTSSSNSNRLRRFDSSTNGTRIVDPSRTYSAVAGSTTSSDPTRRNYPGYAPLRPHSTVTSLSASLHPSSTSTSRYASYGDHRQAASAPTRASAPTTNLPFLSLFAAPLVNPSSPSSSTYNSRAIPTFEIPSTAQLRGEPQTYRSNSLNFPLDTSPMDLLGLDWDEFGERLLVATEQRIWEWDVDVKARRSRGTWSLR